MEKRENKVKDLAEKLETGELTPKEILKMLEERGLRAIQRNFAPLLLENFKAPLLRVNLM